VSSPPARNGVAKPERQRAILEVIRTRAIRTQGDLVAALRRQRVHATQATVSRDIRDLGLLRVHDDSGPRYVAAAAELDAAAARTRMRKALAEHVQTVEFVDLLGIVHTAPGSASVVAAAIDAGRFEELAGCVAGDDTVLMVARSRPAAQRLLLRLKHMMDGS
jgi:transcriptional regulator of arginine metabolism